jgi:hypothetical protein
MSNLFAQGGMAVLGHVEGYMDAQRWLCKDSHEKSAT